MSLFAKADNSIFVNFHKSFYLFIFAFQSNINKTAVGLFWLSNNNKKIYTGNLQNLSSLKVFLKYILKV